MSQHDQVIDNGSGLTVRTDFNAAIAALFSNSSGPVEPSVTVAGQFWWDTSNSSNPVLRQRNLANTGWLTMFQAGQAAIDIAAGKRAGPPKDTFVWNDKVDLSGTDVMTLDDTGNLSITGKVTATDIVAPTINGKPIPKVTARARNRVNNPTAQVSQENGTAAGSTPNFYPADQWLVNFAGIAGSGQKVTINPTPEGTTTAVAAWTATAKPSLAAADCLYINIPVEGLDLVDLDWGTAAAKPVVLRFCAIADVAGTYGVGISGASTRTWLGSFTIAAAGVPQVFSFAIPGDTAGAWVKDNTVGMQIRFTQAAGSNFIGVAGWQAGSFLAPAGCINGASTAFAKLSITDVGLHSDPEATGVVPPFNAPPYEDDLARCQRYWQKVAVFFSGNVTASGTYSAGSMLCVPQRTVPTLSGVNLYANGFPSAAGTLDFAGVGVRDNRVAGSAVNAAGFGTTITCNARLI